MAEAPPSGSGRSGYVAERTDRLPSSGLDGPTTFDRPRDYPADRLPRVPAPGLDGATTVDPLLPYRPEQTPKMDPASRAPEAQPMMPQPVPSAPRSARAQIGSAPDTVLAKVCPRCGMRYPAEFNVCPKDAVELVTAQEESDELVGTILADTYAILRPIGEGGMGRVYEARHTRIAGKRFAVKMLLEEFARSPEALSRFQREAETAASIQSPHVADVYDVGRTQDGRPFMVCEFLEGMELAALVKERGRLEIGFAVLIAIDICMALEAAHRRGIIHRDMKPENVFLVGDRERPTTKVIDFGLSKVREAAGPSLTKTGMIMGTPSYMAPEQARGERVDHRADVYATGAILYELVTNKRPFDRLDATATITAVLLEEPERVRAIAPDVPPGLELAIQRAMAKAPEARFQSIAELRAALTPFSTGPALGAPAKAGGTDLSRLTIAVLGGVGAVGVLGVFVTMSMAAMRLSKGGKSAQVTLSEALLLWLLYTLALATPVALGVHWVRTKIWQNSVRTAALAAALRRGVLGAFVVYGLLSLLLRMADPMLARSSAGVTWPGWDLWFGLLAVSAGITTFAVLRAGRLKS